MFNFEFLGSRKEASECGSLTILLFNKLIVLQGIKNRLNRFKYRVIYKHAFCRFLNAKQKVLRNLQYILKIYSFIVASITTIDV